MGLGGCVYSVAIVIDITMQLDELASRWLSNLQKPAQYRLRVAPANFTITKHWIAFKLLGKRLNLILICNRRVWNEFVLSASSAAGLSTHTHTQTMMAMQSQCPTNCIILMHPIKGAQRSLCVGGQGNDIIFAFCAFSHPTSYVCMSHTIATYIWDAIDKCKLICICVMRYVVRVAVRCVLCMLWSRSWLKPPLIHMLGHSTDCTVW